MNFNDATEDGMQKRPVCVECRRMLRPRSNDALFIAKTLPGRPEYAYAVYADLWICDECGKMILTGFADNPVLFCPTEEEINTYLTTVRDDLHVIFEE